MEILEDPRDWGKNIMDIFNYWYKAKMFISIICMYIDRSVIY